MKFRPNLVAQACHLFWQKNPALLYGLAFLIGCTTALSPSLALCIPLSVLYAPLIPAWKDHKNLFYRLCLSLIFLFSAYLFTITQYQLSSLPKEGIQGNALVTLSSLRLMNTPFGKRWQIQGELQHFTPSNKALSIKRAPIRITLPWQEGQKLPEIDGIYRLGGKLTSVQGGYRLAVKRHTTWSRVKNAWSLGEWRFHTKQRFQQILNRKIDHPNAAAFLAGLATGDFSDREVTGALGRFGLQHIMAISGFHFSIIASLLSLTLSLLFPRRAAHWLLIAFLCSYLVFLGPGASIMRAWVSSIVIIIGQLLEKHPRGLNTLGVALLILLLIDPPVSQSIAFQLSFLAAGAILLFFSPIEMALQQLFPKRPLSQVISMHGFDQHGIVLLALFRGALALGLAINLVMMPVTLYYFQKFPWLSLFYNLFFPFLVSVSMLLLLVALPLHLILSPLASVVHQVNSAYTQWVLNLTLNVPTSIDYVLRVPSIPTTALIAYLSLLGAMAIALAYWIDLYQEEREALTFL